MRNGGLSSLASSFAERQEHRRDGRCPRWARRSRRSRARTPPVAGAGVTRAAVATTSCASGVRSTADRISAVVNSGPPPPLMSARTRMPGCGGCHSLAAALAPAGVSSATSASLKSASLSDGDEHRRLLGRHADGRARRQRLTARDGHAQRRAPRRAPTACATPRRGARSSSAPPAAAASADAPRPAAGCAPRSGASAAAPAGSCRCRRRRSTRSRRRRRRPDRAPAAASDRARDRPRSRRRRCGGAETSSATSRLPSATSTRQQLAVGRQLDRARRLGAHRQIHRLEQRRARARRASTPW